MCLVLPARVISVNGEEAEVELHGGMRAVANLTIRPDVAVGQYVLVDRGLVLEVIEASEAEGIIRMYDEIGELLDQADSLAPLAPAPLGPTPAGAREGAHD